VALTEFSVIKQYFSERRSSNPETKLGIGDDCALLNIPDDHELVVTTDTMVEAVHFFSNGDAESLGYKLLAVNLSDLASMGARPIAVTLALTMPKINPEWLTDFASGFFQLAERYSVDLIGGDTTSGPLTLTVQALGLVSRGTALYRSTAKPGHLIYLTGNLGSAGLGLKALQGYQKTQVTEALLRFHRPEPRIEIGLVIQNYASACIDVSDGLLADLGHILESSQVGACLDWEKIPLSNEVRAYIEQTGDWDMPLTAGDDYELCFSVEPEQQQALESTLYGLGFDCSHIGNIEAEPGLRLNKAGIVTNLNSKGFEHFSE
jgi:thiamine-monophosphate kinase